MRVNKVRGVALLLGVWCVAVGRVGVGGIGVRRPGKLHVGVERDVKNDVFAGMSVGSDTEETTSPPSTVTRNDVLPPLKSCWSLSDLMQVVRSALDDLHGALEVVSEQPWRKGGSGKVRMRALQWTRKLHRHLARLCPRQHSAPITTPERAAYKRWAAAAAEHLMGVTLQREPRRSPLSAQDVLQLLDTLLSITASPAPSTQPKRAQEGSEWKAEEETDEAKSVNVHVEEEEEEEAVGVEEDVVEVEVEVEEAVREVPDTFLSVALSPRLMQRGWLNFNTSSPLLLGLTRALAPAVLRVGGSAANFVTYDPVAPAPADEGVDNADEHAEVYKGPCSGSQMETLAKFTNFTITSEDWSRLLRYAEDVGMQLLFDLNHFYRESGGGFDSSNARLLIRDACDWGSSVAWQLGNEPNSYNHKFGITISAEQTAMDYKVLRETLQDTCAAAAPLVGPDVTRPKHRGNWRQGEGATTDTTTTSSSSSNNNNNNNNNTATPNSDSKNSSKNSNIITTTINDSSSNNNNNNNNNSNNNNQGDDVPAGGLRTDSVEYLKTFLAASSGTNLSAVSWHQYYVDGHDTGVEDFLNPDILDQLVWQVAQVVAVRDEFAPGKPIWLTETGSAFGGGAPGLSNAFAGGFLWLDKLGVAARGGVDVVTRQTLYSGCYALMDPKLVPYPDYWLSVLYKRLVGGRVLRLYTPDAPPTLRLYAHCLRPHDADGPAQETGGVVVLGMNLGERGVQVRLRGQIASSPVLQYLLHPPADDLHSRQVMLNDEELHVSPEGVLPPLLPASLSPGAFTLPPATLGFWVLPQARAPACV